ncbi:MAG TPA: DUF6691 family protein [Myxococcota bacterium]|nr:DUF6691 family protein [Myxococcota bacterium]
MMRTFLAGLFGTLFGAGLAVSGMTNPAKVLAFLDVAGEWDATLAFVMGGALAVSAVAFAAARRLPRPWLAEAFALPARRDLDTRLLGGAVLFGVGWGLVGLCPGPALASVWRGEPASWAFVASLVAGTLAGRAVATGRSPLARAA